LKWHRAGVVTALLGAALLGVSGCMHPGAPAAPDETQYQALSRRLQDEVGTDQVQIAQLEGRLKVTIVNQLLFPEGAWALNDQGRQTLDKLIPTLTEVKTGPIQVDGFTDNVPIGAALRKTFPTNWQLSSARADAVVQYLQSEGVDANLLVAAGYGDTHPIAPNTTPQGRARNRRIEVTIVGE
jgi:chemotaxis protein MotB